MNIYTAIMVIAIALTILFIAYKKDWISLSTLQKLAPAGLIAGGILFLSTLFPPIQEALRKRKLAREKDRHDGDTIRRAEEIEASKLEAINAEAAAAHAAGIAKEAERSASEHGEKAAAARLTGEEALALANRIRDERKS